MVYLQTIHHNNEIEREREHAIIAIRRECNECERIFNGFLEMTPFLNCAKIFFSSQIDIWMRATFCYTKKTENSFQLKEGKMCTKKAISETKENSKYKYDMNGIHYHSSCVAVKYLAKATSN